MVSFDAYEPSFDVEWLKDERRKRGETLAEFIALDTETSHNHDPEHPVGWIYQWCFAIGCDVVVGRTPRQLMEALDKVGAHAEATGKRKIICYVHNLSYDLCYLRPFLLEHFPDCTPKMLAIQNHKYISFSIAWLEFRCSYKLSNKSLEKWGNDLGTVHRKLVGAIDYETIHTQQEELDLATDWAYQVEDVLTLQECIYKTFELYHDKTTSVPLTSTGYVRREVRRHYRSDRKNRKRFICSKPTLTVYQLLERAFAGGLTHGNRFYAEETIEGDIRHRDYTSHYPSQQRCSHHMPVGKFCYWSDGGMTVEEVLEMSKSYCLLMEVILKNPRVKGDHITLPVISESKALQGRIGMVRTWTDNGRILSAQGVFMLVVTSLDFKWIIKQYDYDEIYVGDVYRAKAGKAPQYLQDAVDEFFFGKSDIKERAKAETDPQKKLELELDLMKSKNALNGIYGMTATKILRESFEIDREGVWSSSTPDDPQAELDKYYASESSYNRYELGVFCTANARDELLTDIELIEANGGTYLYADTDSCFYLTTPECERAIEEQNVRRRTRGDAEGTYIETGTGRRIYYNQFMDEEEKINKFRFLHAKCYAYEVEGKLKAVIAGVSPFEDATRQYSREQELGSIDNLKGGFVFKRCGGTTAYYDDARPIAPYYYNGQPQESASACIIRRSEKTLNNELTLWDNLTIYEQA